MSSSDDIPEPELEDEQYEQIEEAGDQLAEASANVGSRLKWAARALWLGILLASVAAIALAVYLGYIDPSITFTGTVNVGWIVEYLLAILAGIIILGLVTALMVAMPGSFISAFITLVVGVGRSLDERE